MQYPQTFSDAHAPARRTPEQFRGQFVGQETFEAQQAVVPVQPRVKLGRPKTAKTVQEGPKRGRGRPSGAKDVAKRVQRGEKAAMSEDCKKMHMAKKRVDRKMAEAERAREESWQPSFSAPIVPQAPTEVWDSGYESASRPSSASLEAPSAADADMAKFGRDIGWVPPPTSQPLPSVPAISDTRVYPQSSFDFGSYPTQEVVQPQPQTGFNYYGQVANNYGPATTDYGQAVAYNYGQNTITILQHPVTMMLQYLDEAWLTC